jgi:imidazolonepropionase-like amidohydrolase
MRRVLAVFAFLALSATTASAADVAIVGARIYPSPTAAAIVDGTIVIHDGRIAAIGPSDTVTVPNGAQRIDAKGLTATAGFWNSHVHITTPVLLHSKAQTAATLTHEMETMFTRWGFTTVFDVASMLDNTNILRDRIASGEVAGPHIFTVGDPFYPEHGTPIYVKQLYESEHLPSSEVATAAEAVARVDSQHARRADGTKLFIGAIVGGKVGALIMDKAIASAAAAEAHKFHQPVFAHPTTIVGAETAIDSGVDILAHTTDTGGPWSKALIDRLLAHHMALIPTLNLFEVEAKKFGESDADLQGTIETTRQELREFWKAGGQVLFGTDIGYTDAYDTHEEFRLMHAAGLDWRAILTTLTVNPATRFGSAAHSGELCTGADADIVLLDGDPAADIAAFSRVQRTIRAGKTLYAAGH